MAEKEWDSDSGYAEALRRIEECRKSGAKSLDLSALGLSDLPPEIAQLSALTTLAVTSNHLSTLPPEIGQLAELKNLILFRNQLSVLPPEVGRLEELIQLNLFSNHLTTLPPEIGNLTALQILYLYDNRLITLPPEIGRLTKLVLLSAPHNQLRTLPPEIGSLTSVTQLVLPNNDLISLPPEIERLTNLTHLYLHGNPMLGIPDTVLGPVLEARQRNPLSGRPADILNYYFTLQRDLSAGTLRSVNEIKVMLVGRGGAGKTSLRRYFLGQPHDKREPETPGIALDKFPLTCSHGTTTVRLWDLRDRRSRTRCTSFS